MNYKKLIAGVLCSAMVFGMGASASADTTATANVEPSQAEASSKKNIRILSYKDVTSGGKSYAVKEYKKKYGGKVEWVETSWDNRYNDLSTYVLGGKGIDLFLYDEYLLPHGVVTEMVQPVNKYVDVKKSVFGKYSEAMEQFKFNGKYYCLVTDVEAASVVYYNKKTIKQLGLEDPYTLWKDGKWNWTTFKKELDSFVDPDKGRYGLDGWYFESALAHSSGEPLIGNRKGKLIANYNNKRITSAMKFAEGLYNDGLIYDKSLSEWSEQPQRIGEGTELFYIGGTWMIQQAPSEWAFNISLDDLGIVPVPSPKGSKNYMEAEISGYSLLKGASNPEYAVKFAELEAKGSFDKKNIAAINNNAKKQYKWTSSMIKTVTEINDTAMKYPVIELARGGSTDLALITIDNSDRYGIKVPFYGTKWSDVVEESQLAIDNLITEINNNIKEVK